MHIAMLSYHTCPLATLGGKDTGGMNVYVRDMTRQLGRLGIHVDVFTRSQDEHVPHVLHDLGFGNRVVHVPAGPETPVPKEEMASYIPIFSEYILNFAEKKGVDYDLIHSHYWMSGIAARELKSTWGIPVIHMFHTLGHMKNRIGAETEREGIYRINGEEEVLDVSDRIVAATPAELAQLKWLYKFDTEKIVVIPPGVDLSHFYPIDLDEAKEFTGMEDEDHHILFVGRIEPLKGIDTLIRAIALLEQEGVLEKHPISVSIIGGEPDASSEQMSDEMARLKALREIYGVGDVITFLGRQDQDTLPYFYSSADVVVMPSHYESFGMVALEAMACGTPVVASEVGGLAFLVKDQVTGFHIPDDDPEALSKCLKAVITDEKLRNHMGEQAAKYAKQYGWENIAEKLVEVYEELIRESEKELNIR